MVGNPEDRFSQNEAHNMYGMLLLNEVPQEKTCLRFSDLARQNAALRCQLAEAENLDVYKNKMFDSVRSEQKTRC